MSQIQPMFEVQVRVQESKNLQICEDDSGFLTSGPARQYSDVQQCRVEAPQSFVEVVLASAQVLASALHWCIVALGEEMCLSSDWHSGNRHS